MVDWVQKLFVENSDMFLVRMNAVWQVASEDALAISKIIQKYNSSAKKVLDLMCGNGRISIHLAKLGFDVVGIDISKRFIDDAINRAKEFGVEDKVRFIVGDARRLDEYFDEEFDVVLSFWSSIGYYDEKTDLDIFRKVYNVTRLDGLFLILNTVSLELLSTYYRRNVVEFYGDDIFIDVNDFDPKTSRLRAKWNWYRREGLNLKFMGNVELYLRIYAKHEVVSMLQSAGWEVIELLHNHRTLEPVRINSPINIIARKSKR